MILTAQPPASWRHILWRHRWEMLIVPGLCVVLALTYEVAQLTRIRASTEGVLYSYILIGEGFAIVQASLYPGVWRQSARVEAEARFRTRHLLRVQFMMFGFITIYNTVATIFLAQYGARLHPADGVLVSIAAAFVTGAWLEKHRSRELPAVAARRARITSATGFKVAPQYIQAGHFALAGSAGFSGVSLAAQVALACLRLVIVWRTHVEASQKVVGRRGWGARLLTPLRGWRNTTVRSQPNLSDSEASLVLNWRDFYSIIAMVAG
ncbi:MAG TPA: hypothetical protein VMT30_06960 [Candidatus Saccharimonadia bacterium]|nr:hypothetical protein [Candidatus Saccharimonadia bacterium]